MHQHGGYGLTRGGSRPPTGLHRASFPEFRSDETTRRLRPPEAEIPLRPSIPASAVPQTSSLLLYWPRATVDGKTGLKANKNDVSLAHEFGFTLCTETVSWHQHDAYRMNERDTSKLGAPAGGGREEEDTPYDGAASTKTTADSVERPTELPPGA
ncbi:hypothetical protein THAOC_20548, partial [Thalassiosira oceanica]